MNNQPMTDQEKHDQTKKNLQTGAQVGAAMKDGDDTHADKKSADEKTK